MENLLNINMFDAVVIGLIVLLSLKGLISGFTKELFNAIAIIGGLFTATLFNKYVAQYIHDNFYDGLSTKVLELISLIAIFVVVYIVVNLIYKIIASLSSDDYISSTSRLGGMLVKMVTLFFVFSLIVFGLSSKPQVTEKFKDTLNSSKLYPLLTSSGAAILNAPNMVMGSATTSSDNNETASKVTKEENKTKADTKTEPTVAKTEKKEEAKVEANATTELKKDDKQSSQEPASEDKNSSDANASSN